MLQIKASNTTSLVNKLMDMARRVERIDGASPDIHGVLLDAHRVKLAAFPVGQSRNLGPSITDPTHPNHVFGVNSNNQIEFGTSVVYAENYNKNTGRDLVVVNSDIKSGIKEAIVNYVGLK